MMKWTCLIPYAKVRITAWNYARIESGSAEIKAKRERLRENERERERQRKKQTEMPPQPLLF
jgi:hypothetical protein